MKLARPLLTSLCLLCALPAYAEQRVAGSQELVAAPGRSVEAAAQDFLSARSSSFGLAGSELRLQRQTRSLRGSSVVRFAQTVGGVRVAEGGVSLIVRKDGTFGGASVDVREVNVDPVPQLSQAQALAALQSELSTSAQPFRSELLILRVHTQKGQATLAYAFDLNDQAGGTRYFVNAHTGSLVTSRPLATHVLGRVHEMNSVETPELVDRELPLIDEVTKPRRLRGWDGLFNVANYVSGDSQNGYELSQDLGPNVGNDFLYDLPTNLLSTTDELAQVNLYYHLTHIRNAFSALGVDQTASSWSLTAVANARENGQALDNAFYSGAPEPQFSSNNMIVIGQGSVGDFAYDSDVFKHEFGHYVSNNAIGYNLGQFNFDEFGQSPFSGSIDEGIADYFACSDNDDSQLGEASLAPLGAGRDLTDTSKVCPDDMIGEVHADGEIIGSLGWSIREEVGRDLADRIVWDALSSLNPGADFQAFALAIKAAAQELAVAGDITEPQRASIDALVAARGLDTCERVIALDGGKVANGTIFGLETIGAAFGASCDQVQSFGVTLSSLFHYSFAPAAGDLGVQFSFSGAAQGSGELDYTGYVRVGQPVSFKVSGQGLPEVDEFDYAFEANNSATDFVVDQNSSPPFDASQRYYLAVVSRSCPTLAFQISAGQPDPEPPPSSGSGTGGGGSDTGGAGGAGGQGGGDVEDGEDGCDCRAATTSSNAGSFALVALALVGLVRRRRVVKRG